MAKQSSKKVEWEYPLHRNNFLLIVAGIGTIVLGYILMYVFGSKEWNSTIATAVAPVILVIGYCVIIPYAIIKFFPNDESGS